MSAELGPRLRAVRQENGLSQRALARRSGISNATISLIESDKLNPSIAVLKKILDGVPTDLSSFFADEKPRPDPSVFCSGDLVDIARGKISFRQVGRDLSEKNIQILHEFYAPGATTGKVALHHRGQEGGVVVRGHCELTLDGEAFSLGPGDAYYFDSSRPHRFRNVGSEECEIVSACSPPSL